MIWALKWANGYDMGLNGQIMQTDIKCFHLLFNLSLLTSYLRYIFLH